MSKKLPETLNEDEILQIIKAASKPHHKLAFMLGFYEGLRVSEVIKLRPENIDFSQKLIRIKESKGKKDRNIPIMPEIEKQLKRNISLLPLKCGARALQIRFRATAKSILGKEAKFHIFRHSCATWLLNVRRWDIRYVQQFLGHSRLDTTQIYTHVSPQNLVDLAWGGQKNHHLLGKNIKVLK